jgi:hypothetical protein
MKIVGKTLNEFTILVSNEEAVTINNALNEVCNGIDVPEFETRMGCKETEARKLLSEFHAALNSN